MLQGAQSGVKAKRTVIDFCVLISSQVRGKGLLNAIVIKEEGGVNAYDVCMKLKDSGLLVSGVLKAHSLIRYGRLDAEMSIIKQTLLLSTREKSMRCLERTATVEQQHSAVHIK